MALMRLTYTQDTPAKLVSFVFHPLFMPLYGMALIFSAPTLFGYLPWEVKKLLFLIILINNVMLPFSLLPFFRYRNVISSFSIEERSERNLPLILTTLLYGATSYIVFTFRVPVFIKSFFLAFFFLSLTVTIINFWWKISTHSVGIGAITALAIVLSVKMYSPLIWYFIVIIIVTGLVLSSRLKLNYHNPGQVWLGYLTGIIGIGLYLWFF